MSQEEHDKPSTSFSSARKSQRSSVSKENKLEKQRKAKQPIKGKSKKEVSNIYIYIYIYVQTSIVVFTRIVIFELLFCVSC